MAHSWHTQSEFDTFSAHLGPGGLTRATRRAIAAWPEELCAGKHATASWNQDPRPRQLLLPWSVSGKSNPLADCCTGCCQSWAEGKRNAKASCKFSEHDSQLARPRSVQSHRTMSRGAGAHDRNVA
jgi:hypothetical protein